MHAFYFFWLLTKNLSLDFKRDYFSEFDYAQFSEVCPYSLLLWSTYVFCQPKTDKGFLKFPSSIRK